MKRTCIVSADKSTLPETADPDPMTTEASSVFDAAAEYLHRLSVVWYANHIRIVEVRSGEDVWRVSVDRVREWDRERWERSARKSGATMGIRIP